MSHPSRPPVLGYFIAIGSAAAVAVLRYALSGILGDSANYVMFTVPVVLAGWYNGLRPALVATVAGAVLGTLLVQPDFRFSVASTRDVLGFSLFVACGIIISALCESLHAARERLGRHQVELQHEAAFREDAERRGLATLQRLESFYETAPIGLCELDRELRYVRINDALARMNGIPAAAHIGRTVREMVPGLADTLEPEFQRVLDTGIPVFEKQIEGYTSADPGVLHCWLESWYPIRGSTGEVVGISVLAQDVTALKRAEASLRQSEAQLRLAVEAANLTAYEWDITTGRVMRLGEVPPSAPLGAQYTFAELVDTIHPDDQPSMLGRIEATLRGETDVYLSEHRSNENPEREWCWTRVRGRVTRAADGTLTMIGVGMDITEHKRLEEALRDADRRKDDFLAMLAHELRNPLAPIRNALHLLKAYTPLAKEVAHGRDVIDRQVTQLARLLDDLLDVSRIARGTLELRPEIIDLRDVLDRALETSQPLIAERGHQMHLMLPDDDTLLLEADLARLAQVFANLLNNAAKYMDEGGEISIHAARQGSDVLVSVRDAGMGIEASSLATVFEMFTRSAAASHRSREGLGIGLPLARSIVGLHGGSLEASSAGPGQGSEFTVRLPLHVSGPPAAELPTPQEELLPTNPWRLVIADDLRDSVDSLADLLRLHGHEVMTAYDGAQAVTAAESFRPDAVLLDIGMPQLDGYEACRRIRALPWGREVLIVALTGWGQSVDRERTKAAGFTHHLVKPVDYATLLNVLNQLRHSGSSSG